EETNLNVQIANLRQALDDRREQGSCIQTVHGYGYRFVAPVTPENPTPMPAPANEGTLPRPGVLIIVLPSADLGDDSWRQYFTDQITKALPIDLLPSNLEKFRRAS